MRKAHLRLGTTRSALQRGKRLKTSKTYTQALAFAETTELFSTLAATSTASSLKCSTSPGLCGSSLWARMPNTTRLMLKLSVTTSIEPNSSGVAYEHQTYPQ